MRQLAPDRRCYPTQIPGSVPRMILGSELEAVVARLADGDDLLARDRFDLQQQLVEAKDNT